MNVKRVLCVIREDSLEKIEKLAFFYKQKGRGDSTYLDRGTGIPCRDKRAHAPGREPIYLSSPCKKYQFSIKRFKAMTSILLNEEPQY
jgi:hypothetical protein